MTEAERAEAAQPVYGIYNARLQAWASTTTDWNGDPTAADVMSFMDEQEANEFIAEYGECFDCSVIAAGFPERGEPLVLRRAQRDAAERDAIEAARVGGVPFGWDHV